MEAPSEENTVYEVNFYYGIHYPITELEYVREALAGTKFAAIAADEREVTIGGSLFLRNVNSDHDETRGVIFPDDMSVQGEENDSPAAFCKFDPAALTESEETYAKCVEVTTDMYDIIIAHYKKISRSVKSLYLGWYVYNCEWCNDSSDEGSDTVETSPPVKSGKAPKAANHGKPTPKSAPKQAKNTSAKAAGKKAKK
jgi:hypothetical protein